jgi:hypothetical protein
VSSLVLSPALFISPSAVFHLEDTRSRLITNIGGSEVEEVLVVLRVEDVLRGGDV